MNAFLHYLWRHPRRTGFIVLNAIAVALFIGWGAFTDRMAHDGIGGVPNVMLGYAGMFLLVLVLIVGWTAWFAMVARRHMRANAATEASKKAL
jgi:hypothetical protein